MCQIDAFENKYKKTFGFITESILVLLELWGHRNIMMINEDIFETGETLDSVEAVLMSQSRPYERVDGEIHFSSTTTYTEMHGIFALREDKSSCALSYIFEQKVPNPRRVDVQSLISILNETLWLGHFEISSIEENIVWRHVISLIGRPDPEPQEMAAIMAAGAEACERFYPAFNFLLWAGKTPQQAAQAALFETSGEA